MSTYIKHTNRLIHEKSPYLLQHAHNPVEWFSWGDAAFQKAKEENKPIFLSIGYSTCHWCHVMERESFEDMEVATMLNKHFISIKVDREERPDIDHIYMEVCQAMTGSGGWPLTIIMTPDKKPFFAGTYYPKNSRRGLPGLMEILDEIQQKWQVEYEKIIQSSEDIYQAMKPRFNINASGEMNEGHIKEAFKILEKNFDKNSGGFYGAPKFPTPHQYLFLLRYWKTTGETRALEMVEKSLSAMHKGGIYDHIGFGFARYSTDKLWLVPHFEKMLYDNALLAYTFLETFQATKKDYYKKVAEEIFTYVLREMQDEKGGFYSAEDADSEGVEGKFYVWTKEEIVEVLGKEEGQIFSEAYNINENGNFEEKNIPNLIGVTIENVANKLNVTPELLNHKLSLSREKLFDKREKRIHPHKDDKILTSWNGLMIAALAKGAQVTNNSVYSKAAERAIEFIFNNLYKDGRLYARYRDGESAYLGYLDDYAFLIWGLIEQYQATFKPHYLKKALKLQNEMIELFWDKENGGFFFYGEDAESLLARQKEIYDGAMPSGNSVTALNLLRLASMTEDNKLIKISEIQMKAFASSIRQYPAAYSFYLSALQYYIGSNKEIVVAGPHTVETKKVLERILSHFLPNAVVLFHGVGNEGIEIENIAPFIKEQEAIEQKTTVYICENYACQQPITDMSELEGNL